MNPNLRFAIPYYQTELVARKIARRIGDRDYRLVRDWLHSVINKSTTKQACSTRPKPSLIYRNAALAAVGKVKMEFGEYALHVGTVLPDGASDLVYYRIPLKTIAESSRICSNGATKGSKHDSG